MTKTMFINNIEVTFDNEQNILEVIRKSGFNVPTFCYRPDLKKFGACRMCIVEVEGRGIQTSCTMPPEEGLKVFTNTKRVERIRKTVLELLLANHNRECTTCEKSGDCDLQRYANEYGISEIKYAQKKEKDYLEIDNSGFSIVRDPNKCILCGACVRACEQYQGLSVLGFENRGSKTLVAPMAGKKLAEVDCVSCGQCQKVCPTGALTIKSDITNVLDLIYDKNVKVVAQFAPAVRVAIGEMFGFEPGENITGKLVAALRRLGFDLVFDTNFSADLTIMEEAHEFIGRLKNNKNLPLFTSCCPAWVSFVEENYPEFINNLSTCRSPQGMMSSVLKEILGDFYEGYTRENTKVVSIMPCTAKKSEARREQLAKDGFADTDFVLTTVELGKMLRKAGIDLKNLKEENQDSPFGQYTGAATIFGVSGGVAEAALRTAYEVVTGQELSNPDFKETRGVNEKSKEFEVDLNGTKLVVRVVSSLKEAKIALEELKKGEAKYHILEVMACPGGCINGGGQPDANPMIAPEKRACGLYEEDRNLPLRKSHTNPDIVKLYDKYFKSPNSEYAHQLLHTHYENKFKNSYKNIIEKCEC